MRDKKFYTRDGVRIATRDPNIIKQCGWAESFGMACGEPCTERFNTGRNNALWRSAFVFRVCRTSQPDLSLGRVAVDRPCGCAATSARTKVAQRSDSAANDVEAD
jgi:hypothetical protein